MKQITLLIFLNFKLLSQSDTIVYYIKQVTGNGGVVEKVQLIKTNDTVICKSYIKRKIVASDYGYASLSKLDPRKLDLKLDKTYSMSFKNFSVIKDFLLNKNPNDSCVKKYDRYSELWYYRKKKLIKYNHCYLLQFPNALLDD